jgi:hypothetical protein
MWLPLTDVYHISEDGQVKNVKTGQLRKLSNGSAYLQLNIEGKTHRVHKLVADRFLPSPTGKCVIDHINRNKHDNRACNLRWVSSSENCINQTRQKRISGNTGHHHITQDKQGFFVQIQKNYILYRKRFKTLPEAIEYRDNLLKEIDALPTPPQS